MKKDIFFQTTFLSSNFLLLFSFLLLSGCALPSISLQAQSRPTVFREVAEIECSARYFTSDKVQHCYLVSSANEVTQYNSKGEALFRYSNNQLGELSLIDATNPFSSILYYPDFLTIITLDRTMNETGEFSFMDLGMDNIKAVGTANDNNLWIYDEAAFQLKKINRSGEILFESDNIAMLLGKTLQANFLIAREDQVYVNDPEQGIFVFNTYGQYQKTLDFKGLQYFQIVNNQLIFQENGKLYTFHLDSLLTNSLPLPEGVSASAQIRLEKDHLFILEKDRLKIFRF